ncbi:transmembrane protein 70 homolog, mitochondrial-like [Oppia nitens]|uniref:transmembrane protein 70 homolog, mitochondrial-like n=1 Tax=Oppia nitens TaxID=1686743 RepID=UPI0023DCD93A|nr:transmembrane protein 70 homolog, mitochondrial-like [Oppia nitens]
MATNQHIGGKLLPLISRSYYYHIKSLGGGGHHCSRRSVLHRSLNSFTETAVKFVTTKRWTSTSAQNNTAAADDGHNHRRGDCLIYSGPDNMVKLIKTIKLFSISTTVLAGGVQPFIIQQILATNSSAFAVGFAGMTSAGILLSPLVLNWFTRRYVTRLYYNYDTQRFTAWTLNLFCRPISQQYSSADVSIPEALGMFTSYTVNTGAAKGRPTKRPFFVDPEFVTDLDAYKVMLGYDRPLDITLDNILEDSHHQQQQEHRQQTNDKLK